MSTGWIAFTILWLWVVVCMTKPVQQTKGPEGQKVAAFVTILVAWPALLWYFMRRSNRSKEGQPNA